MCDEHCLMQMLREGELYAGLILERPGSIAHHVALLPGEAVDVSWRQARAWAEENGGELPNRRELSLLYTNLKEQFAREWYWSSDPQESRPPLRSQLVWGQNFTSGIQTAYGRPYLARARLIRRLQAP